MSSSVFSAWPFASEQCLLSACTRFADYLIIPIIGIIMASSNLFGYFKCSREAKDQLQGMTTSLMTSAATSTMTNMFTRGGAAGRV